MTKPELLLPVGTTESFFAALDGGADAIYLGLKDFNARKRAANFTIRQLPTLTKLAHRKNTRVYITLNTVIKNNELPELITLLFQLEQSDIDAIIIQDWGVFHIARKHFPKLSIHASTQMAFHNSLGSEFAKKAGLDRIILARELTQNELDKISKRSEIELELFVHGALCYSFSGMCLFSSYLGGMSANRGSCKQPCRRLFTDTNEKRYIFSLKDNELIDYIPYLTKTGVKSLKIEGRMKSADYVYTIASAYRMVLDDHSKLPEARELLKKDIGRDKTSYFFGSSIANAITELPNTGLYIGQVKEVSDESFTFSTKISADTIKRIRLISPGGEIQISTKLNKINNLDDGAIKVPVAIPQLEPGFKVYTVGFATKNFPSKFEELESSSFKRIDQKRAFNISKKLIPRERPGKPQLYFRIDSLAWLRKIRLEDLDLLILNLTFKELNELNLDTPFLARNKHKLLIELPKFIGEEQLERYIQLVNRLSNQGIKTFVLNHISQVELIRTKTEFIASEYIYSFNDAAIAQLKDFKFTSHIYPGETDIENLTSGADRSGVVPLHFTPQLFYSRMPVKLNSSEGTFTDDTRIDYRVVKRAGMTHTLPQKPVSILQNKPELTKQGFRKFLIDVSFTHPSQNTFKTLIRRYYRSEQFQPSTSFNFKKGLS